MIKPELRSAEHFFRIPVADSLYDVFQDAFVIRESSALDLGSEIIAEDPSEIFVPCVGQETS